MFSGRYIHYSQTFVVSLATIEGPMTHSDLGFVGS